MESKRELVAVPGVGREGRRDGGRKRNVGGVQDELAGGKAVEEDEEGPEERQEVGLVEAGREGGRGAGVQDFGTRENLGGGR